jgi:gliding motility-associated-like protein
MKAILTMKRILLVLALILPASISFSQVSPYSLSPKWMLGYYGGIDFTSGAAVLTNVNPLRAEEMTSAVCDPAENIVAYSNNYNVVGNNNVIVGTTVNGSTSSTNGPVIFPDPADPTNAWYLVTGNAEVNGVGGGLASQGINVYRVVKAGASVTVTFISQIATGAEVREQLYASADGNGGYWILSRMNKTAGGPGVFYAWPVTASGIGARVSSNTSGNYFFTPWQGSVKISRCQTRVAYAGNIIEVYQWNRATGQAGALLRSTSTGVGGYGCEFSPDGNFLYYTSFANGNLYQLDIATGTVTNVGGAITSGGSLQLGPDGRIYRGMAWHDTRPAFLGVIANPNVAGAGCNYTANGFALGASGTTTPSVFLGVANQPWINPNLPAISATGAACSRNFSYLFQTYFLDNINVVANSEVWNFGDGTGDLTGLGATPTHAFPSGGGTFTVRVTVTDATCGETWTNTTSVVIAPCSSCSVGAASSTPTLCINTALTAITHTTSAATGIGAATGLPAGVTASYASNTITISGTPTASGTFNYSIPVTGTGCPPATGTITVTPNRTASAPSSTPTLCISSVLTAITHTTTGATGIGAPTGLPAGVTAAWAAGTITISGTPSASGTFNYTIPLTGGCGAANASGTITVTPNNTAGAASSTPTLCINAALTNITHTTTGATGIGAATGLPAGVTAAWAANTITISGTPSASGTFNYSIPLTGGCGTVNATGTITVTPANTVGAASSTPTLCINAALTNITHTTTGATGIGAATGLPAGVTAAWAANTITISGTPSASGTFNYSIPLTGGCGTVNATGTITVTPNNTAGAASSTPTLCINAVLTNITHTTTGATGIGAATGLPAGVTAAWAANTITISGTPSASGTFSYSIPLTGGCGTVNATGTITVTPANTVGAASSSPNVCINSAITAVTHSTTGATGIGAATGLPAGVTAAWAANTITISGTPSVSGTFNYSIPLTGGCGSANATGTITVVLANTAGAASATPTLCISTALTAITHTTSGATGIGAATGLPAGVTAAWAANTITISGTPSASGTFNYSIPLTGGCGSVNATGTITVTPNNTAGAASSTPTLCINAALTNITHTTTGATGIGAATGLPAGVTAAWAANTITISGTPSASGTFNYSIPLTGGCGTVNATGTITVTPANTVGAASSSPSVCINTAITAVTHTTTGATGIGAATGLPTGVTAAWAANTLTISGTPSVSGTFNYSVPLTGGCGSVSATGTISVVLSNTAGVASTTPTLCISTALTAITHTTSGATGIGVATGLPVGVTAAWAGNTITISGTPSASGTFAYTIPLTGGCGSVNATGTITVTPNNTVGAASSTPTLCINTALTAITHTTTGATGIGAATGLPAGVTAAWAANTITITGNPSVSGTFTYTIPLTGGCGAFDATGTITVTPDNTVGVASSSPSVCVNTAITSVTHATTGATGIGAASGLPAGVTAAWAGNTITISGTPTASGTFNYTIPLTGGCGSVNATGTITVVLANTASAGSSTPTLCINTALTAITHTTTGATGIGAATGLPAGVTAAWAGNTITISGTPTASGSFNYTIPLAGGCGTVNATGTITVTPSVLPAVTISADNTSICASTLVTFTATPTNEGTTPVYQWQLNSANVGTNSATYSNSGLANGDVISVILTSNAVCANPITANSNTVTISVVTVVVPTVSISVDQPTICAGTNVTFSYTSNGGGASPTYQWIKNGTDILGQTGTTYSDNTLVSTDQISVRMLSSDACASPASATSTTLSVTVNPNVTPSVSIVSSDADNEICQGTSVTFTATPTNGGSSPAYQWQLNGSPVTGTVNTLTTSSLANGDVVRVILTSSETCVTLGSNPATSNQIATVVLSTPSPITGTTSICADIANGLTYSIPSVSGASSYLWVLSPANGTILSGQGTTAITTDLTGNVSISVTPSTSNGLTCGSSNTSVIVRAAYIGGESLVANEVLLCEGQGTTVSVAPPASGATYSNWTVNSGGSIVSTTANTANVNFANGGTYTITVQAQHECLTGTRTIGPVNITVLARPRADAGADQTLDGVNETTLDGSASDQSIGLEYNWTSNNGSSITDPSLISTLTTPAELENIYTLTVGYPGLNGCENSDEVVITVKYTVDVPNAFSPNGDNNHDVFIIKNIDKFPNAELKVFSQWGELIYQTDDVFNNPWNGKRNNSGQEMPTSAYYYVLYLNQGGAEPLGGHINLIR